MSPIFLWGGNIETTSFNMVIFDRGMIFKKTVGLGGISGWSKMVASFHATKTNEILWEYCQESPRTPHESSCLGLRPAECVNIHCVHWNFVALKEESGNTSYIIHFFIGPINQLWTWNCILEGDQMKKGSSQYWERISRRRVGDELKDLYHSGSVPLSEITIAKSAEDQAAEDWSGGDQAADDWSSEDHAGGDQAAEGRRVDPYDLQKYSKQEFIDYYGTTLEWDVQSPEKALSRQMIGNMIAINYHILSTKSVNHLLDKIIETFL